MFAIICTARKGSGKGIAMLALTDRRKIRQRFWTSDDPGQVRIFPEREEAEKQCAQLTRNSPRVVPLERAKAMLRNQAAEIREAPARSYWDDIGDPGWDAHKFA